MRNRLVELMKELPPTHKAIAVLVSTLVAGVLIGFSFVGLTAVPDLARSNHAVNIRQDSMLAAMKLRDDMLEQKFDRLVCMMTAQYEGTNPLRCNR